MAFAGKAVLLAVLVVSSAFAQEVSTRAGSHWAIPAQLSSATVALLDENDAEIAAPIGRLGVSSADTREAAP